MNTITEIQIIPIKPRDGLIGFASIVLDRKLFLSSIGIYKKLNADGYRITYPTKKIGDKNINIYHPINRELGVKIENEIIQRVKEILEI